MSAQKTMSSIQIDAIELLQQHRLTPESLLLKLEQEPTFVLQDKHKSTWTFVKRNHSRRHLMAKTNHMKKYEEIYCASH